MKIYNVSLQVSITQIAELPDLPPEPEAPKPFNDDPLDKQANIMDRYLDRVEKMMHGGGPGIPSLGQLFATSQPPGASMTENVRIAAYGFDDLQAILKKFSETMKALPAAPDSLLAPNAGGGTPLR